MKMRVLLTVLTIGALAVSVQAQTGAVYSLNVVGFQKVAAPNAALQLGATPFDAGTDNIDEIVGDQLTGGNSFTASDNLLLWDAQSQAYSNYFLAGGVGAPYDGHWFTPGLEYASNYARITPGEGFWLRSRQASTQTVVLVGDVVDDDAITNAVMGGLQICAYPYSTSVSIDDTGFYASGGHGGNSFTASDNIMIWDEESQSYSNYFLADGVGAPYDGHWYTPELNPAADYNVVIEPGQAFWYRHRSSGFNWIETKPYTLD